MKTRAAKRIERAHRAVRSPLGVGSGTGGCRLRRVQSGRRDGPACGRCVGQAPSAFRAQPFWRWAGPLSWFLRWGGSRRPSIPAHARWDEGVLSPKLGQKMRRRQSRRCRASSWKPQVCPSRSLCSARTHWGRATPHPPFRYLLGGVRGRAAPQHPASFSFFARMHVSCHRRRDRLRKQKYSVSVI